MFVIIFEHRIAMKCKYVTIVMVWVYNSICMYHIILLAHHNKLEEMVAELSTGLTGIKHEQEYMEVRERIHRMSKNNISPLHIFHVVLLMQLMITQTPEWYGGLCLRHSFLSA